MNYWMAYELAASAARSQSIPNTTAESFSRRTQTEKQRLGTACSNEFTRLLSEFGRSRRFSARRTRPPDRTQPRNRQERSPDRSKSVLWQMVAHNSYHIGQIAMIRRALGAWPPRAGGDTW